MTCASAAELAWDRGTKANHIDYQPAPRPRRSRTAPCARRRAAPAAKPRCTARPRLPVSRGLTICDGLQRIARRLVLSRDVSGLASAKDGPPLILPAFGRSQSVIRLITIRPCRSGRVHTRGPLSRQSNASGGTHERRDRRACPDCDWQIWQFHQSESPPESAPRAVRGTVRSPSHNLRRSPAAGRKIGSLLLESAAHA